MTSPPDRTPDICVIAPSPIFVENARKVAQRKGVANVGYFVAVLDEALPVGRMVQEGGAKVVISRKGTAMLLDRHLDIPVVKVNTTMNDYLRHLHDMRGYRGRIGIVEYADYIPELKKLCHYIGIRDALLYSYDSSDNYEQVVKKAVSGEATILLGGGASLPKIAKERGIPHTIVENTEESIEVAFDVAQQLLAVQREEENQKLYYRLLSERYSTVLRFSHNAVVATDGAGVVTVANPVALGLLRLAESECVGVPLDSIFPQRFFYDLSHRRQPLLNQLIDIKGSFVSANLIPVMMEDRFEGVVCAFQSAKNIQATEQKIRLELHQKGHVAKYGFHHIVGGSHILARVKEIANCYAKADSTILLLGETGVGKELFAQSIHNASARATGPFIAINCASLGKDLLESQLFGYEEGTFTGAVRGGRAGFFEVAHGGTIFLDEIGEIPLETQIQLLRVLQEKEVRRVGGHNIIPVDVRVICATNRELEREVAVGHFRRDLFYRINILQLDIPPLRKRREDIPALVKRHLAAISPRLADKAMEHMNQILERLGEYDWPGNIRELIGLTERVLALLEHGASLGVDPLLMDEISRRTLDEASSFQRPTARRPDKAAILRALSQVGYSKSRAAAELGISRSSLWRYMKKFAIVGAEADETTV